MAFDVAEMFFGDVLLFARTDQGVLSDDPGDGVAAARQGEFLLDALGPKAGLPAEFDDLTFQAAGGLMRTMVRAPGAFGQRGGFAGDMTSQPFTDGVATATEFARGGLATVLGREGDELLMQPMAVGAHTIEFKVSAVHRQRMAGFARRCCASSGGGAAAHPCVVCSTL